MANRRLCLSGSYGTGTHSSSTRRRASRHATCAPIPTLSCTSTRTRSATSSFASRARPGSRVRNRRPTRFRPTSASTATRSKTSAGRRRCSRRSTRIPSASASCAFTKGGSMTHPLRFGLKASGQWITIDQLRSIWKIGDEGGFDHLWDFDHLASIGPNGPGGPVYEGWALQAASGETTLRLVARHGDVWNIAGGDDQAVKDVIGKFEEACGAVGRDPSEIRRSLQFFWDGQSRDEVREQSAKYLEMGITEQVVYMRGDNPDKSAAKLAEMLPELRRLAPVTS